MIDWLVKTLLGDNGWTWFAVAGFVYFCLCLFGAWLFGGMCAVGNGDL